MTSRLIPTYPPKELFDPDTGALIGGQVLDAIRGAKEFQTGQFPNITIGQMVIGAEPLRRAIVLRNLGAVDIYLGPDQTVTPTTGWLLSTTDGPLVLESADEIWAVSADGTAAILGWLAELDI